MKNILTAVFDKELERAERPAFCPIENEGMTEVPSIPWQIREAIDNNIRYAPSAAVSNQWTDSKVMADVLLHKGLIQGGHCWATISYIRENYLPTWHENRIRRALHCLMAVGFIEPFDELRQLADSEPGTFTCRVEWKFTPIVLGHIRRFIEASCGSYTMSPDFITDDEVDDYSFLDDDDEDQEEGRTEFPADDCGELVVEIEPIHMEEVADSEDALEKSEEEEQEEKEPPVELTEKEKIKKRLIWFMGSEYKARTHPEWPSDDEDDDEENTVWTERDSIEWRRKSLIRLYGKDRAKEHPDWPELPEEEEIEEQEETPDSIWVQKKYTQHTSSLYPFKSNKRNQGVTINDQYWGNINYKTYLSRYKGKESGKDIKLLLKKVEGARAGPRSPTDL